MDLHLSCAAQLKAARDAAPKKGLTIRTCPDGTPMDCRHLARVMRKERERLHLLARELHALRFAA
ncbi:MAG: hypothetical protein R6V44_09230 [Paracoccaceae bacterium]